MCPPCLNRHSHSFRGCMDCDGFCHSFGLLHSFGLVWYGMIWYLPFPSPSPFPYTLLSLSLPFPISLHSFDTSPFPLPSPYILFPLSHALPLPLHSFALSLGPGHLHSLPRCLFLSGYHSSESSPHQSSLLRERLFWKPIFGTFSHSTCDFDFLRARPSLGLLLLLFLLFLCLCPTVHSPFILLFSTLVGLCGGCNLRRI